MLLCHRYYGAYHRFWRVASLAFLVFVRRLNIGYGVAPIPQTSRTASKCTFQFICVLNARLKGVIGSFGGQRLCFISWVTRVILVPPPHNSFRLVYLENHSTLKKPEHISRAGVVNAAPARRHVMRWRGRRAVPSLVATAVNCL